MEENYMMERNHRKRGSRRQVVFFGLFGVSNIGNEASLRAAISVVRRLYPDYDLRCVCHNPVAAERDHGIPCVSMHMAGLLDIVTRLPRALRAAAWPLVEFARWVAAYQFLCSVDVLLIPGTGILDDFGERPSGMPITLLRWSALTRLTHTRLAFVGIGAGPIRSRTNRVIFRRALTCADSCSYRDLGSREYMRSIGRDTDRDEIIPDVVFALDAPRPDPNLATIGVGTMAYYGWTNSPATGEAKYQRYIEALTATVEQLCVDGWRVRLLVGEATDERAVDDVIASLTDKSLLADKVIGASIASMDDLFREIAQVGVVFATRYHNVVGALLVGRPVISAGYAPKNDWLLDQVGLREHCQSVDDFRPIAVVESARRLRGELPLRFRQITMQIDEWRLSVEVGFRQGLAV